jgi:hypothetical protein
MRLTAVALAALALLGTAPAAEAHLRGLVGNDTGGIIPWSPEIRYVYRDIAAAHCARYNRNARITAVHAWYGDYVTFSCYYPRHRYRDHGVVLRVRG